MRYKRKSISCRSFKNIKPKSRTWASEGWGLFGSFAREQQDVKSDIDVLVEFEDGCKTLDNFMQLAILLEELFGRRVESITPEALSPYIGPHIMREVEYVPLGT